MELPDDRRTFAPAARTHRGHHPLPGGGCGGEGGLRSSRRADGPGSPGLRALGPAPAVRSHGCEVAAARPLRALERPRLDAALRAAAPVRVSALPRRDRALPAARLEDAGASGIRRDTG